MFVVGAWFVFCTGSLFDYYKPVNPNYKIICNRFFFPGTWLLTYWLCGVVKKTVGKYSSVMLFSLSGVPKNCCHWNADQCRGIFQKRSWVFLVYVRLRHMKIFSISWWIYYRCKNFQIKIKCGFTGRTFQAFHIVIKYDTKQHGVNKSTG